MDMLPGIPHVLWVHINGLTILGLNQVGGVSEETGDTPEETSLGRSETPPMCLFHRQNFGRNYSQQIQFVVMEKLETLLGTM